MYNNLDYLHLSDLFILFGLVYGNESDFKSDHESYGKAIKDSNQFCNCNRNYNPFSNSTINS